MRADLQRFYGLNLDRMGSEFSAYHAACCLANVPKGSALAAAIDPANEWDESGYLLAQIEFDIRSLTWALAGGKKSKSPKPKRIETPSDRRKSRTEYTRDDIDAIADALGIPEDRR